MRRIHHLAALLILLIGAVHVGGTFVFYDAFDASALWFMGAGFFVVSASFINLLVARASHPDRMLRLVAVAMNIGGLLLGVLSVPLVGGPPSYALTVLFLISAVLASISRSGEGRRADGPEPPDAP